jgi:hydrogenase nickel incorporation protein HypA/HybF
MHELSIAQAVVAITERHADGRAVTKVELEVGRLRQVVPSALEFSWELVADGTVAQGSELQIVDVPVRITCRDCGSECEIDEFPLGCRSCGSVAVDVVAGDELRVVALELEEEERPVAGATP